MSNQVIYTFWEPREAIIPYLNLCRKTWELNSPDFDVITLDYSNLHQYIEKDVFNLTVLKKLTLPMQKDAVMVAVLEKHGGLFLDLDTIIFRDVTPLFSLLRYQSMH